MERYTPEELAAIDAALTRTNGNRSHAAAALGMPPKRLYGAVATNPILNSKWGANHPDAVEPHLATEIHRERGLSALPIPQQEEAVAVAVDKQDALLHKGWAKLGFDGKERKFLAQLQATYTKNYAGTIALAAGGAAHANTRLLLTLESVTEKIQDIGEHPEKYRVYGVSKSGAEILVKNEHDYFKEMNQLLVAVSSELRKMGDSALKANELRLKVEKMRMQQESEANKVKKVAGWTNV